MKINSDLLKGSSVDGIICANNFKCKNWFIPTLYSDESLISHNGMSSVSLSSDEYTFVANAADMYFGQVSYVGKAYIKSNGILYDVSNMKKISFNITNSDFNAIFITTYNSSKISLGYGVIYSNKGTYTIPSGAKYMTFRFGKQNAVSGTTYKTKVQIETGDIITDYTPYKNFENEEIYSTNETRIGTFMGKPLYRKVINTISPSNEIGKIYNASSLNIDNIINMYCVISAISFNIRVKVKLPYYYNDNDAGTIWLEGDNITLRLTGSTYRGQSTILFLEYTKTTD